MQVVRGSEVDGVYWALSYSWNQSGEITQVSSDEYQRDDNGKHQIVSEETWRVHSRWRHKSKYKKKLRYQRVKFEGVIQQICRDFGIQYVWYDQLCITQDDHDEKIREIKQMHLIYQNAYCTVALIPELQIARQDDEGKSFANIDVLMDCEWSKRAWTLEEAYMSKRLLLVGRDCHMWPRSGQLFGGNSNAESFLRNFCDKSVRWSARTVLWSMRTRSSSKAHDRIFALINMFPEFKDKIDFSYKQYLVQLMIQFYHLLATKGPDILCFGVPFNDNGGEQQNMLLSDEEFQSVPSWTGIRGMHVPSDPFRKIPLRTDLSLYKVASRTSLVISCACIPICIEKPSAIIRPKTVKIAADYTADKLPRYSVQPLSGILDIRPAASSHTLTFVATTEWAQHEHSQWTKNYGLKATHFLPVTKDSGLWLNTLVEPTKIAAYLSLTEEGESTEYLILSGIPFDLDCNYGMIAHPVLARLGEAYRSVGICVKHKDVKLDYNEIQKLVHIV